jgi:hypothetical protein
MSVLVYVSVNINVELYNLIYIYIYIYIFILKSYIILYHCFNMTQTRHMTQNKIRKLELTYIFLYTCEHKLSPLILISINI